MEEDLIELAHSSTAAQLETLLRAYGRATADDDAAAAERRGFSTWWEDDGTLSIQGNLPADEGALLLKALEIARDELLASYVAHAEADGVPARDGEPAATPNRADALVALAETTISRGAQAASGGDRHQVVVHIDAGRADSTAPPCPDCAGPQASGGSAEPPGPGQLPIDRASVAGIPLSPEAARRLACDASIVTLVEKDGVPLSVGRKTRSIPPAIRRALASRDRCCSFPGCEQERYVDAHHLVHWVDGGETSLDNLMLLCRRHHRLVHEGRVTVEGTADAPRFRRSNGSVIEPAPALSSVPASGRPTALKRFSQPNPPPWGKGEPMDLDLAVFVLAHRRERRSGEQAESHGGIPPPPPMTA